MMIIHIAEANSNQIVEIRGSNLREMLCVYRARNRWDRANPYNFVSTGTNSYMTTLTFFDKDETLHITRTPHMENAFYADWEWV